MTWQPRHMSNDGGITPSFDQIASILVNNNNRIGYPACLINKEVDNLDKNKYIEALQATCESKSKGKYYTKMCIKYAERLLDNDIPVIFDSKHLSMLLGTDFSYLMSFVFAQDLHYKEVKIPKKNGDTRCLNIPSVPLKYIQRWILDNILSKIKVSEFAYGFIKERSIVDNAKLHTNKECVINMDISNFFPSICYEQVFRIFFYYGYTKEVSFILARLCTYNGCLPQGSPASPYISNIVCLKLDKRLVSLAMKYNADYSRYADDITFSGNSGVRKCIVIISKIIEDEGFSVNMKKTRIAYRHQKQEVTGLIVNGGNVRVDKKYKRKLQQDIYYCQKYGVSDHLSHIGCDKAFYKDYMYGKAYFVKMVEPELGDKIIEQLDNIGWLN